MKVKARSLRSNAGDRSVDGTKGVSAKCDRYGEVGHKKMRCPGQVCGVL